MTLEKNKRERIYMWDDPIKNDIRVEYYRKGLINLANAKKGGRVLEIGCGGWGVIFRIGETRYVCKCL